jgi:hypothetical protein
VRASRAITLAALLASACGSGGGSGGGKSTAPAAPSDPVTSTADYNGRAEHIATVMLDAFHSDDCDVVAADLTKFVADHGDELGALKAWEKDHHDDEQAFDSNHHDLLKSMTDRFGVVAVKCKPNAAFQAALSSIPE